MLRILQVKRLLWIAILAPAIMFALGLGNILGAPSRTAVDTFDAAKEIAPMPVWGSVFLVIGAFSIIGAFSGRLRAFAVTLWVAGAMHAWWSVNFALAALHSPQASMNAWVPYAGLAAVHLVMGYRVWMEYTYLQLLRKDIDMRTKP